MCGIAGYIKLNKEANEIPPDLFAMIGLLKHRGPETTGFYRDDRAALAHARLSIVDLAGGIQPIPNEQRKIWVSCNGEIYNHHELRAGLQSRGHTFKTASDCEVLVHLYEDSGWEAVTQLNGQYAFALWDAGTQTMTLGRDRLGVRPLFYTTVNGYFLFASEIKALLAAGAPRRPNHRALAQVFTTWSALPGYSVFDSIYELPPGHILTVKSDETAVNIQPYWHLNFASKSEFNKNLSPDDYAGLVREKLAEAVKIRLKADVPVGAYLSGGLDSSLITALAHKTYNQTLHTFSITFQDNAFDERNYQERVAREIGTIHHTCNCSPEDLKNYLPEVIWHSETPLLRLSPVPMYLLARSVHQQGIKVVLTGEGADEFFGGYDIFKEAMVRRFWAKAPDSAFRYRLLSRIYPQMQDLQKLPPAMLKMFFGQDLTSVDSPLYSHQLRWRSTYRIARFFQPQIQNELAGYSVQDEISGLLPVDFLKWEKLSQAQYLEVKTFLSTYLLSSQGDRMAMAHAVEGRFPFLDPEMVELACRIPPEYLIRGLRGEKAVLKKAARNLIPDEILARPKQPYRAPISSVFAGHKMPGYATELLSEAALKAGELFEPAVVSALVRKVQNAASISESDQMAFVGILTYQIWHDHFIKNWETQSGRNMRRIEPVDVSET